MALMGDDLMLRVGENQTKVIDNIFVVLYNGLPFLSASDYGRLQQDAKCPL